MEPRVFQYEEMGVREAQELGLTSRRFKGHVATDCSFLGRAGKWRACGWAVVQLDYDEEMVPLHGMYGSMDAEFEVQRTIKRSELTAFLCLLERVIIGQSGSMLTTRELSMDYEKDKVSV